MTGPETVASCDDILGPGGPVSRRLDGYRPRSEQLAMSRAVERALRGGRHLMVEAGTGVGKSFAYLVPAILRAAAGGGTICVSTHTINLQEQIVEKDLPFLRAVLPFEFTAALVKGRSNYLCMRRFEMARQRESGLFSEGRDIEALGVASEWVQKTDDGSLSDFPGVPPSSFWSKVAAEAGNCLGPACRFYKPCFYQESRRRMHRANLLIVNHHLFFSDLALRARNVGYLPPYRAVIFDEAHTVEDVATEHLGTAVSGGAVKYLLDSLWNPISGRGFLSTISDHGEALRAADGVRAAAEEFFLAVREWVGRGDDAPLPRRRDRRDRDGTRRLVGTGLFPDRLPDALSRAALAIDALRRHRSQEEDMELSSYASKCLGFSEALREIVGLTAPECVYWAEADPVPPARAWDRDAAWRRVSVLGAPLDVGPLLRDLLYAKVDACVFTSATMAVRRENGFEYLRDRLGLPRDTTDELRLGSPFDYARKVRVRIRPEMPDPRETEAYLSHLERAVREAIDRTDGHALVLFTSYRDLERIHGAIAPEFEARGIRIYRQGADLQRTRLLELFKADPRSVLFGTDSFWQGIDVPGEALTNVIICRLPFPVPGHPLAEARLERVRARGGDPFMEVTLPQAVLKFRQGFGRLIRTDEDHGVVHVLDPRVLTKPYGRAFLDAIPECPVDVEGEEEMP